MIFVQALEEIFARKGRSLQKCFQTLVRQLQVRFVAVREQFKRNQGIAFVSRPSTRCSHNFLLPENAPPS